MQGVSYSVPISPTEPGHRINTNAALFGFRETIHVVVGARTSVQRTSTY